MNIHFTNLSAYTKPLIVEDKRKEYVAYGEDNMYFQYLIDRYSGSTTNQAVIDSKSKMVYGKGLAATDAPQKIEDWAKFKSILADDDLKRVVLDRVMLGMAAILVTRNGSSVKLTHWPMDTLRAAKLEENDNKVEKWFYHPDWKKVRRSDELDSFKSYHPDNTDEEQILVIKPYVTGSYYYPTINYSGSLGYALLEEEITDYLINDVQGGFSGTKVINYNNGIPTPAEQKKLVTKTEQKLLGSKGLKTIIAFNEDETRKTTVDDIPLNDAPSHYQYLSEECERKILRGHRSPSVLLGFNADNSGLGNNAEELKNKMIAFDNYEIKPFQEEIIDHINLVINNHDISLNLYFKTLEPLEFNDMAVVDEDTREEETGVQLGAQDCCETHLYAGIGTDPEKTDSQFVSIEQQKEIDDFISKGEDIDDDWEVIDERDVEYDLEEELDSQVQEWEKEDAPKENLLSKFLGRLGSGTALPNTRSKQDEKIGDWYYKVRYRYAGNPTPERPFCRIMMGADKLYRKEDIIKLEQRKINPGWGPYGTDNYSIWKYKGGGNCKHLWRRVTFRNKKNTISGAEKIGTADAAVRGYRVTNDWEVSVRPNNMPNAGFVQPNKGKG